MAKGEQQDDGTRGGVGTITRTGDRRTRDQPARPARPVPAPRPTADPGQPDPRQSDPRQSDPRRADPRQPDPRQPDPRQPDPRQPDPRRADPRQPDPRQLDPGQLDPRRRGGAGAPWRVPPGERPAGPRPDQGTRSPQAPAGLRPRPQAQPRQPGLPAAGGPHRMPFVLLLCGLLGGALVSALVISTTLAEGSFEITKLQSSTTSLARQRQALEDQVAQAQSAPVIEAKAAKLGMREVSVLRFINVKSGKITTDAGATQSYIPGYMP